MNEVITMKAKIKLFDIPDGRKTPFKSGYRPVFDFQDARTKLSGKIDLINTEFFSPGMIDVVEITFVKEMIDDSYFKEGVNFRFGEGKNVLGEGEFI